MNQSETRATSYTTIGAGVVHELEIKRSRFITYLRRVETEQEARDLVAELRRSHFDARHHCTAFVLGADRDVQRSNDDGEPSGTAGAPMLEALTRRETHDGGADLSDVAAVVVRYFGGVLLGAGGLVRAYSESVSAALDEARLVRRQRMRRYDVVAEMTIAPRLENDLRTSGYQVLGTDYSPGPDGQVRAGIRVALADAADVEEAFSAYLASHTAGGASWQRGETEWVDL
ncbi:YigZ family protein [Zhihengliuella salsuginis]|uniref:YigZ family protein n=1 Tax=Zhihengliuella salsuginis TaxID=578222 RepID=A0ABQ3GD87_9MICC|nr:YigZ family protein [Zhihengliuella salsuginis]GHD01493.1 YigZ family protein [Zhihengliuella salsuginis]